MFTTIENENKIKRSYRFTYGLFISNNTYFDQKSNFLTLKCSFTGANKLYECYHLKVKFYDFFIIFN